MDENTRKFEIKIDPLDFHVGLKDNIAEFESLIRMKNPEKNLTEKIEKDLKSRFCHCCFFGHVEGELMGEPLCKECAKTLYGFDADEYKRLMGAEYADTTTKQIELFAKGETI